MPQKLSRTWDLNTVKTPYLSSLPVCIFLLFLQTSIFYFCPSGGEIADSFQVLHWSLWSNSKFLGMRFRLTQLGLVVHLWPNQLWLQDYDNFCCNFVNGGGRSFPGKEGWADNPTGVHCTRKPQFLPYFIPSSHCCFFTACFQRVTYVYRFTIYLFYLH